MRRLQAHLPFIYRPRTRNVQVKPCIKVYLYNACVGTPTVTFPAAERQHTLTGIADYTVWWQNHYDACDQFIWSPTMLKLHWCN